MKREDLADALGVDVRMVGKYRAAGMPMGTLEECREWVAENFPKTGRGGKADRGKGSAEPTFRQLQEAKLRAAVQMAELEIAEKSGELLDRGTAIAAVFGHVRSIRQRLEQLPMQAAKRIAADLQLSPDKVGDIRKALDDEVRRLLVQIAADPIPAAIGHNVNKTENDVTTDG